MGAGPEVAKGMVLVPMTRAPEPRDTDVSSIIVPGALRVRVVSPMTIWVGMMVTVTAPGGTVEACGVAGKTRQVQFLKRICGLG